MIYKRWCPLRNTFFIIIVIWILSGVAWRIHYINVAHEYIHWEEQQHTFGVGSNPYELYIDLSEYRLYLIKNKEIYKKYSVAGGKQETPSPFGVWKIIEKSDWGEWYGGSWLGLNIPWGTYGIHGTLRPGSIGRSASHGCIRMFNRQVKELFDIVPVGTPVVITNGPFSPFGTNPRTIIPGDRGSDVMHIQMILRKKGLYKGTIDGIYGDGMKEAVFSIQKRIGIAPHNEIDIETLHGMGIFIFE